MVRLRNPFFLMIAILLWHATALMQSPVVVQPVLETDPSPGDDLNDVAIWVHPENPELSLIIGADEDGGLISYGLDGRTVQTLTDHEAAAIDIRSGVTIGGEPVELIAVMDPDDDGTLRLYQMNIETRLMSPLAAFETGIDAIGTCLYISGETGVVYAFILSETGLVQQWALEAGPGGELQPRTVREFAVGSEVVSCIADDELGHLFISETAVALWRYPAEPDSTEPRRILDTVGGRISDNVEGVTLYLLPEGEGYLIASNEDDDSYLVYERSGDHAFVGEFEVGASGQIDSAEDANGISATSAALGPAFPEGLFVTSDDKNTNPNADANFKLVDWRAIMAALEGQVQPAASQPPAETEPADSAPTSLAEPRFAVVTPSVQTEQVDSASDAADDAAIWVHPSDPERSLIITTDKTPEGGLRVYDLSGKLAQFLQDGRMNNVDVRYDFPLGGELVDIVAASERRTNEIRLYRVDPATGELENVNARAIESGVREVYGLCMYRSAQTGNFYVFVNSEDTGEVEQWELFDAGNNLIDARLVRTFRLGSQTEGCVADDQFGFVYIGEEDVAIWKYGAEPDAGEERVAIDRARPNGFFDADVEGLTLYLTENGGGYLIASSQGDGTFTVYERGGNNAFIGSFKIEGANGIDGVSGTDGIAVTSAPLGSLFPHGVFVAQDGRRDNRDENQNFKLVDWDQIANALGLTVAEHFDPREPS